MRSVRPDDPARLDLASVPVDARAAAIAEAVGKHPSGRHQARKIDPSDAPLRCHTCGHIDRTNDQGQAMDRHVDREHGGAGGSSMVLDEERG